MNETPTKRPRLGSPWVAALVLIVVFALGVLAGVAADRRLHRHPFAFRARGEHGLPSWAHRSERDQRRFWDRMANRLDLTPAQRAAIDSLVVRRAGQLGVLRREGTAIVIATRRQIDSLLTPEQRAKMEELRKRRGGPRHHR